MKYLCGLLLLLTLNQIAYSYPKWDHWFATPALVETASVSGVVSARLQSPLGVKSITADDEPGRNRANLVADGPSVSVNVHGTEWGL